MLTLVPVVFLLLATLLMLVINRITPRFKYHWIIAVAGTVGSLIGILLWKLDFPSSFAFPAWSPENIFHYSPSLLVDGVSFPYALSLVALACTVIFTASMRDEIGPLPWSVVLLLSALG